jgi:hypothetical protein
MSLNDFHNVASQLRTVPELLAYLDARRDSPEAALRRVGDELPSFERYLVDGALQIEMTRSSEDHETELTALLERMEEYHYYSSRLEHVADALATRSSTCLEGLPPDLVARFDAAETRRSYLGMQEVLADLSLRERAELGRQFDAVIGNLDDRSQGYTQATAQLDSKPDWVFVFGCSKGWERAGMLRCMEPTMGAALAYYRKTRCMIVIDRDGAGYEVAITRLDVVFRPSPTDVLNGEKLFGSLRMTSRVAEGF